jgi:hypothetical protein
MEGKINKQLKKVLKKIGGVIKVKSGAVDVAQ